jgi:DNA polymerase V
LVKREINTIHLFVRRTRLARPLFVTKICAGFPSPADDYIETRLDLNEHLVRHPVATFFTRVQGDSMTDEKIYPGDLLIIDRAAPTGDKSIVVALLNGDFCIRKLRIEEERIWLEAANERYPDIEIVEGIEFQVWGRVMHVVHSY